ncbi:MAG: formyltransferase family protein [Vicinamibacterales bacterium]
MTARGHRVSLCFDKAELDRGDVLFLVSCAQIVGDRERSRFGAVLVLHASDLPAGRGWSPHVWAVVGGASTITVCLIEANDPVDSGDIWGRVTFTLEGHELLDEINDKLFDAELALMTRAVDAGGRLVAAPQVGAPGAALRRRTPDDSRLDPSRSLADQFDLLRVVDNDRYPAFFDHLGHRYYLRITKASPSS